MNALARLRLTATKYLNSLHNARYHYGRDAEQTTLILDELLPRNGLAPIERCHQAAIAEARANGEFATIVPLAEKVMLAHRAFVNDVFSERDYGDSFAAYGNAICDLDRYLPAESTGGEAPNVAPSVAAAELTEEKPPIPDGFNSAISVYTLRGNSYPITVQPDLFQYLHNKPSVTLFAVGQDVYGDPDTPIDKAATLAQKETLRKRVDRLNEHLSGLGVPIQFKFDGRNNVITHL